MVDNITIDELMLWVDNHEPAYRQMLAWAKNYNRKTKKGIFDAVLGLKGMEILANQTIKSYRDEHGLGKVDRETKDVLKQHLLERVLAACDDGEC